MVPAWKKLIVQWRFLGKPWMAAELSVRCFEEGEEQWTCLTLCTTISTLTPCPSYQQVNLLHVCVLTLKQDKNAYVEKRMLAG